MTFFKTIVLLSNCLLDTTFIYNNDTNEHSIVYAEFNLSHHRELMFFRKT